MLQLVGVSLVLYSCLFVLYAYGIRVVLMLSQFCFRIVSVLGSIRMSSLLYSHSISMAFVCLSLCGCVVFVLQSVCLSVV